MKYNELELKKLMKKDYDGLSPEERVHVDILNFIRTAHLNQQDFYSAKFDTKYFGDVEITFKKDANCLIGHCRVNDKTVSQITDYVFTENGFELLNEVVED